MPTRKRSTGKKKSLKSKRKSSVLRNEKKENSLALQEGNLFDSEVGKTDALFINSPIDIDLKIGRAHV